VRKRNGSEELESANVLGIWMGDDSGAKSIY
jgi:hypothetical protein